MNEDFHLEPDMSGLPLATAWIGVEAAAALFANAGMPRNSRTIRRYCARGDLDCKKTENVLHQPQYFISQLSVETYIEQQRTLLAGRPDASGQDQARPAMSDKIADQALVEDQGSDRIGSDTSTDSMYADGSGHVRAGPGEHELTQTVIREGPLNALSSDGAVVKQLQARIKDKDAEIVFLRGELLHRRTTDTALHDVIAAFRANAEAQRLSAVPRGSDQHSAKQQSGRTSWSAPYPGSENGGPNSNDAAGQGTSETKELLD